MLARCFEAVVNAEKVDAHGPRHIHANAVDPSNSCGMDADVCASHTLAELLSVQHVTLDERQIGVLIQAAELQGIAVQVVVGDHLIPGNEALDEVRRDEPGATGDEDSLAFEWTWRL